MGLILKIRTRSALQNQGWGRVALDLETGSWVGARGQLPALDKVILNWFPLRSPLSVQRLVDSGKGTGEEHEKEPGKNPPGSVPGVARVCARQSDQTRQAAKALWPRCPEPATREA